MTREEYETLLSSIMDIGKSMLVCGAEIYRVEDTIKRLVCAYEGNEPQVTAVPSHILLTVELGGREYTLTRRVDAAQTNLERLSKINNLSRFICRERPDPGTIRQMLQDTYRGTEYRNRQTALFYGFTAASFALFFGGAWQEALASALVGTTLYWVKCFIKKIGGNLVFADIFCSAYSAFIALLSQRAGLVHDADKIIIGVVMVLIPGVELLNSFRDFIAGDIQAGIMHLAEALFLAVVIAVGAAGVFALVSRLGM